MWTRRTVSLLWAARRVTLTLLIWSCGCVTACTSGDAPAAPKVPEPPKTPKAPIDTLPVNLPVGWTLVGGVLDVDLGFHFMMSVAADASGAVYAAGQTKTNDVFLAKFDAKGKYDWFKVFGGPDWEMNPTVSIDPSGSINLVGDVFRRDQPGHPGDCFLAVYDPSGRLTRTQLLPAEEVGNGSCMGATDQSGDLYVAGESWYSATGGRSAVLDIFLTKYTRDGKPIWSRTVGSAPATISGCDFCRPNNDDILSTIAVDPLGGVFVVGYTSGSMDGAPPRGVGRDAFVVKFDADGTRRWSGQYGVAGQLSFANDIAPDWEGGVYVAVQANAGAVVHFGGDGTVDWTRNLDAGAGGSAISAAVAADRSGVQLVGIVNGGDTSHDFRQPRPKGYANFLAKLSPTGALLGMSVLDAVDIRCDVLLPDGDVVAAGSVLPYGSGIAVVRHHETAP